MAKSTDSNLISFKTSFFAGLHNLYIKTTTATTQIIATIAKNGDFSNNEFEGFIEDDDLDIPDDLEPDMDFSDVDGLDDSFYNNMPDDSDDDLV